MMVSKQRLPALLLYYCLATFVAGSSRSAAARGSSSSPSSRFEPPNAYGLLARAIQSKLVSDDDNSGPDIARIVKALKSLSATQKTFKGLDGAAHEAYQLTHHTTADAVQLGVAGRATRSAARVAATAKGLGACELCELVTSPQSVVMMMMMDDDDQHEHDAFEVNGTLVGREVVLNITDAAQLGSCSNVSCIVLYEPGYSGPSGSLYGTIDDSDGRRHHAKGRLLIALGDTVGLEKEMFDLLERKPRHVRLSRGPEAASIQPALHDVASAVLRRLEPILRQYNTSAIHFTGHSLAGGLACISAAILNGEIPLAKDPQRRSKRDKANPKLLLQGLGRDRTSAAVLGSPPCFSSNVASTYITSIMYGDDIVCRISPLSFERFIGRAKRAVKRGGLIGKRLNFMADTISLASSNLKSHAIGSDGEELRLSIPGNAYLVRPRRIGGTCSIHEIGNQLKGGREALRAAVLWQLNEVLLSRSLWRHHSLESYIHGLDRVQLRGVNEDSE